MPDGEDLSLKVSDLEDELAEATKRADAKEEELEKANDLLASCKEVMARVIDAAYGEGLKDTLEAITDLENFHNKDLRQY